MMTCATIVDTAFHKQKPGLSFFSVPAIALWATSVEKQSAAQIVNDTSSRVKRSIFPEAA